MVRVRPGEMRSEIVDSTNGLEIFIPATRNFLIVAFLVFWLAGWTVGEVFAIRQLLGAGSRPGGSDIFLIGWLGAWTIGGAFAIYTVLWSAFGQERVTLRHDALVTKREVFGIGRSREYDLNNIRNLRIAPALPTTANSRSGLQALGLSGGVIAFDYGATTVRFGAGIEEAEAGQILQPLTARHAFPAG